MAISQSLNITASIKKDSRNCQTKQGAQVTDDSRQTDNDMLKCLGIVGTDFSDCNPPNN